MDVINDVMDFRRAQRNLNLLLVDGNPDNSLFSENDNPDRFNSSPVKSFNDTQVPDFDLISSDTDIKHPITTISQEITENKEISRTVIIEDNMEVNINRGDEPNSNTLGVSESTKNKTLKNYDNDNKDNISDNNNNNYSNQIFLNTQIQSRLDEANKEMEMKSQLNQFKYTQEEFQLMGSPLILKKINSNTNSHLKQDKKIRKISSQPSRSSYLMEMLSGKNKKVRDILKNHNKKTKAKSKTSTKKNKKIVYDIYNEEEWTILKQLLLEKFPENTNEDINEIFNYVYGDSELRIEENMERNSVDMWSASQQSLYISPKISQDSHFPTQGNNDEKLKLLSLSQVMENTSGTDINQINDTDNNADEKKEDIKLLNSDYEILEGNIVTSYRKNQSLIIDSDNSIQDTDYKLNKESIEKDFMEKDNAKMIINDNRRMGHNHADRLTNNKDHIVIYDSMEEEEEIINRIHIEDETKFKKHKIYYSSQNASEILKIKTAPGLGSIPLLPFDPISPEKKNSMINLTQGSFKVTSELVSPIKSIPSELSTTKELLIEQQVQVPATRTTTFNDIQEIEKAKYSEYVPDIILKIHKEQLNNLIETQDYFKIQNVVRMNETDHIVYDSYGEEENNGDIMTTLENDMIVTLESRTKSKTPSALIISPIKSSLKTHEIDSFKVHKDIQSELWESQSVKDVRLNIHQIGLKTSRKKAEMIESLKLASQVLQSQGVLDITSQNQTSKDDIFKYLSLLAKQFPSSILEKFYTFQAIPITEVIENFNLINPFVDRIEEQTIKEWAESNGIILCQ